MLGWSACREGLCYRLLARVRGLGGRGVEVLGCVTADHTYLPPFIPLLNPTYIISFLYSYMLLLGFHWKLWVVRVMVFWVGNGW